MKHPRRSITRDLRTRRPKRPNQAQRDLDTLAWPEAIRVREIMTPAPATIRSDATVATARTLMSARRIRHLPVLDGRGRLAGVVTDRDLRQVILSPVIQERLGASPAPNAFAVEEVMTRGVITVRPDADIREAARLMYERKIGALPVVERDRLVGILSETDLLRVFDRVLRDGVLTRPDRWGREA